MKIGILTFPNSPSHGASLQMFGLYYTLLKKGHDVEIINYTSPRVIHRRKNGKKTLRSRMVGFVSGFFVKSSKKPFEDFEKQIKMFPQTPIGTTDEIKAIASRYDRIIVGSDQVWNPVVTGGDLNFYLKFSDNPMQKASYAPSFGISEVTGNDKDEIAELLADFKYLCVREKRGAEIIKELTGKDVPVVIDPTLLVEKSVWEEKKKNIKLPKGKYVLFYTIKPSPKLKKFAQDFCDKHNYTLITIGGRLREFIRWDKHPVSGIGPAEFLGLVNGAEYVVTNSFHGTAFSIIFNKNFYVEYSSDTNSRLTNIVDTFKLSNCVVNEDTLQVEPVKVDYENVNRILKKEKDKSLNYLEAVVSE
ncbi:MAG: polysaccharide pyruvyl transferase family protein [Ruminococcaceae bacterium]|nr:polysaccharide pyruvyl transferase family protein [Oscillospiraceae bacterium]